MNTHRLVLLALPLVGGLLLSCNEPTSPQGSGMPPAPAPSGRTPVHLAVGNAYNWRVTRIGPGTFFQWNEFSTITGDTVLGAEVYCIFSSGEVLRSAGDTVFASSRHSPSVYYRLNVRVGDLVPFIGYLLRVTAVDTEQVLGETQAVVTVSNESVGPTDLVSGRYASKFGIIRIEMSDSVHVTTTSLWGARLGGSIYGTTP